MKKFLDPKNYSENFQGGLSVIKRTLYQRKVDVDMLNALKSVLADVSSVSPSSEQRVSQCDKDNVIYSRLTCAKKFYMLMFQPLTLHQSNKSSNNNKGGGRVGGGSQFCSCTVPPIYFLLITVKGKQGSTESLVLNEKVKKKSIHVGFGKCY